MFFTNKIISDLQSLKDDIQLRLETINQQQLVLAGAIDNLSNLINVVLGASNDSAANQATHLGSTAERLKSLQQAMDAQVGFVTDRPVKMPEKLKRELRGTGNST